MSAENQENNTVVVIGAGTAGIGAAIKLAQAGFNVKLIEAMDEALKGSSDASPSRLGIFHYPDIETAKLQLEVGYDLAQQFPQFILGSRESEQEDEMLQRVWYLLVQDSHFPYAHVAGEHETLKQEYAAKIKSEHEPAKPIFGPPEKLSLALPFNVYKDFVNGDKVVAGFDTAESFLDWPALKRYLLAQIKKVHADKITFLTRCPVIGIEQQEMGYKVIYKDEEKNQINHIQAGLVVNCTWNRIPQIDAMAGLPIGQYTHRVKAMVEVELDPVTSKRDDLRSMVFAYGPHAALSIRKKVNGIRKAFVTYEPATNLYQTTKNAYPKKYQRLLAGKATRKQKNEHAKKIRQGAAQYMPFLKKAKILDTVYGNVTTVGKADIHSAGSSIHKRTSPGVLRKGNRWISDFGMKLTHFDRNAKAVLRHARELLLEQLAGENPGVKVYERPHIHEDNSNKTQAQIIAEILTKYDSNNHTIRNSDIQRKYAVTQSLNQVSTAATTKLTSKESGTHISAEMLKQIRTAKEQQTRRISPRLAAKRKAEAPLPSNKRIQLDNPPTPPSTPEDHITAPSPTPPSPSPSSSPRYNRSTTPPI